MVNKIIKKELQNEFVMELFKTAKELMPIVDGVIATPISFEQQKLSECNVFSFHNCEKYIRERLPLFYKEFLRMKRDGELHYSRSFAGNASCDNYTGELWLGREDTIQDDLFMIHEFMHHMNLKPINKNKDVNQNVLLRELFGESLSIMGELDFGSTIEDEKLKQDLIRAEANNMLVCKDCAVKVKVELFLLELFIKYGELSEEIIKAEIESCSDVELALLVADNYESILVSIDGWGANLKFGFNLKYVLGVVVGYHLAEVAKKDSDICYRLAIVCRRMYELSIDDFCKLFELDLNDTELVNKYINKVRKIESYMKGQQKVVS